LILVVASSNVALVDEARTAPLATLELPGDPLGLGAGPHEACAIAWSELGPDDADRLIVDHLGDDLLAVVPGAFDRDPLGRCAWRREDLEPIALVGGPGMGALGPTWRDALPSSAVLFLDRRVDPPAVVGWDGSPVRGLVRVSDSLAELR
jgi:hypothetical protein